MTDYPAQEAYRFPNVVDASGKRVLVQANAMTYRPRRVLSAAGRAVTPTGLRAASPYRHDSWAGDDEETIIVADADDTAGNGIFDSASAPAVQHAGNGVFEGHYSEPGYLYRERLTEPGAITDSRTGDPVIHLPAGTSWPSELAEAYRSWDAETPRHYGRRALSGVPSASVSSASTMEYALAGLILGASVAVFQKIMKNR
jgi:hypothetical protein